jgi:hypothetical protein
MFVYSKYSPSLIADPDPSALCAVDMLHACGLLVEKCDGSCGNRHGHHHLGKEIERAIRNMKCDYRTFKDFLFALHDPNLYQTCEYRLSTDRALIGTNAMVFLLKHSDTTVNFDRSSQWPVYSVIDKQMVFVDYPRFSPDKPVHRADI